MPAGVDLNTIDDDHPLMILFTNTVFSLINVNGIYIHVEHA